MKKMYAIILAFISSVLIVSTVSLSLAAGTDRELTSDEKAAFIVRDEWTEWVRNFTASLSELDKNATSKIYDDMDFYDMQYRFTEKYKKVPEWLDEDGKPTQKLKDEIKKKRKEINAKRIYSSELSVKTSPTKMIYSVGEQFDPTGLVVRKNESDGTYRDITYNNLTMSNFTFDPDLNTNLTEDDTSIVITYGGDSAILDITIQ